MAVKFEVATFAGGCFWCTEGIFQRLKGVKTVVSGYAGGNIDNPTYEEVSSGETGHAEAIQITFDPSVISYKDLVYVFLKTHDPTTKDRQGNDVGTQYRSALFYHDEKQKMIAEETIKTLDQEKIYSSPIVTEVLPFKNFFKAEGYHQNYYNNNPDKMYCKLVIDPKIKKLEEVMPEFLKK